jgi:hypothetical protein
VEEIRDADLLTEELNGKRALGDKICLDIEGRLT